tara:strand:+ start:1421 stop:1699 length:279 start_codon:yes stop_codon:yes gene_type:complete
LVEEDSFFFVGGEVGNRRRKKKRKWGNESNRHSADSMIAPTKAVTINDNFDECSWPILDCGISRRVFKKKYSKKRVYYHYYNYNFLRGQGLK